MILFQGSNFSSLNWLYLLCSSFPFIVRRDETKDNKNECSVNAPLPLLCGVTNESNKMTEDFIPQARTHVVKLFS